MLADVGSVALLALVLLGVVGLVYRALRPGGWLGSGLDYLWEKRSRVGVAGRIRRGAGRCAFKRVFFPASATDQSDLLLYFGLSLGMFFLFRLLVTGSL